MMKQVIVHSADVVLRGVVSEEFSGDKETILFVHGFPDNRNTWSEQLSMLAGDYRVAAFDLRGAGESGRPRNKSGYRAVHLNVDLETLINALVGEKGQVHLVGHDWGAMIAWRFVSEPRFAARVKSYTAVAGPHPDLLFRSFSRALQGGWFRGLFKLMRQALRSWYIWLFQWPFLPEWGVRRFGRLGWRRICRLAEIADDSELYDVTPQQFQANALHALNLYRQLTREAPFRRQTRRITVPCQTIVPLRDFAINPFLYDVLEETVERYRRIDVDANHWVHRQLPGTVSNFIREAVSGQAWAERKSANGKAFERRVVLPPETPFQLQ